MSQNQELIIKRMQKILALAKQGVGGEQENAQRMLDTMLAKYNLTLADLGETEAVRSHRMFACKNKTEEKLLIRIVANTIQDWDGGMWRSTKKRHTLYFDLTPTEFMEVDMMFDIHRRALKQHLAEQDEIAFSAYIHMNRIYASTSKESEDDDGEMSPEQRRRVMAIVNMMQTMDRTPVHKAISHKESA